MPWNAILPELILLATAFAAILLALFEGERPWFSSVASLAGLALSVLMVFPTFDHNHTQVFSNAYFIGPVTQYFKVIIGISAIGAVALCLISEELKAKERAELLALTLLATWGIFISISASHLLLFFLSVELVSVASLVAVAFLRKDRHSSEAAIKLFVHSGLSLVFLGFGIVLLFGITKSFFVFEIRDYFSANAGLDHALLWLAFGFIFASLAMKIAVFPFHFLKSDVLQGSAIPVSAFFAVTMTVSTVALLLKVCIQIFSQKGAGSTWVALPAIDWPSLIAILAAATMTVGNLNALFQKNLKRYFGFITVAQVGNLLLGLSVANVSGLGAILISCFAFMVVCLGFYFVIQIVGNHAKKGQPELEDLNGFVWMAPFEGVLAGVFLLSFAGLPPLLGFVSQFYSLGAVVESKQYWLAVVVGVNWVIGLYCFLGLVHRIFSQTSSSTEFEPNWGARAAIALLAMPTIILGVVWQPFLAFVNSALARVIW